MADVSDSQEQPVLDSAELEMKKKRLLEELEYALAPNKDAVDKTVTAQPSSIALGIEVIDETALLESVAKNGGVPKQANSRRRGGAKNNNNISNGHNQKKSEERPKSKSKPKCLNNIKYSRKELEAMRFMNMAQQRKFWKSIHAAFQSTVASEYDTLASTPIPHNKPILSVAATNGRWRYMNVFVH